MPPWPSGRMIRKRERISLQSVPGSRARNRLSCEKLAATLSRPGGVPERPKGAVCKTAGSAYGGSNPPAPISRCRHDNCHQKTSSGLRRGTSGAGRRDCDRHGQAASFARMGGGGAAMDCGDGCTIVRPSPNPSWEVRSLSRWKGWKMRSASVRADDRAGIGDGELAVARDGAGADPDVAGVGVVADRVVDEVGDRGVRRAPGRPI